MLKRLKVVTTELKNIGQKQISLFDKAMTVIKKHGALGVMAIWLYVAQTSQSGRISVLETKLYSCLEGKKQQSFLYPGTRKRTHEQNTVQITAVLPCEVKFKKYKS